MTCHCLVSEQERCCMERERQGMIELNTLQTVTMRGIHLFWCQAGNLEAVRLFPAPTLALTGWEPSHRHIHQHMFVDTFQECWKHIQITQSIRWMPRLNFRVLGKNMSWVRTADMHVFFCSCDISFILLWSFFCTSISSSFLPVTLFLFLLRCFSKEDEIIFSFDHFSCSVLLSLCGNNYTLLGQCV